MFFYDCMFFKINFQYKSRGFSEVEAECIEYRKVNSVLRSVEEEELGWVHGRAFL